jgi:Helix-turn-helix domain
MTSRRDEAPSSEPPTSQRGGFQAAKEGWLKLCASYPNLSGADLAVGIALSTYMNSKTRVAWPSLQRLAADTNRNRSTVSRSLDKLEELELIGVVHGRGRKKPNRYQMKLGALNAEPQTLRRRTTPRGKMLRTRNGKAANSQRKGCELAARTSEEPQTKCRRLDSQAETFSNESLELSTSSCSSCQWKWGERHLEGELP